MTRCRRRGTFAPDRPAAGLFGTHLFGTHLFGTHLFGTTLEANDMVDLTFLWILLIGFGLIGIRMAEQPNHMR